MKHSVYEGGLKYRPDYKWPEPGTDRKCPRFGDSLEIIENKPRLTMVNHGGVISVNGNFLRKTFQWNAKVKNKSFNLGSYFFGQFVLYIL